MTDLTAPVPSAAGEVVIEATATPAGAPPTVALDLPIRPSTRQGLLNQLLPGESPPLSALKYVILFSAETEDAHEHSSNWVCIDDEECWKHIGWVDKQTTMNHESRTATFTLRTVLDNGMVKVNEYHTFCRVEFGKRNNGLLTTYKLFLCLIVAKLQV